MADLAFEVSKEEPSDGPGMAYADDGDGADDADGADNRGVFALDGRYQVKPDQPLPDLSTSTARAFLAVDSSDPSQHLYALITDPKTPFRLNALNGARDFIDLSVLKPVQWGSIDWP